MSSFGSGTNGLTTPAGNGLIGALTYFGLDTIGVVEKADMRAMFARGGALVGRGARSWPDYRLSDVLALERLLRPCCRT